MRDSSVPVQAAESKSFQVGPDVIVDLTPAGRVASVRAREVGRGPRPSPLVRVPGTGSPLVRERFPRMPYLEVFLDGELRVASLRVI